MDSTSSSSKISSLKIFDFRSENAKPHMKIVLFFTTVTVVQILFVYYVDIFVLCEKLKVCDRGVSQTSQG